MGRRNALVFGLVCLLGTSTTAFADPVPTSKPIVGLGAEPFIEGVDVPRGKALVIAPKKSRDDRAVNGVSVCNVPGLLSNPNGVSSVLGENGCGFEDAVEMTGVKVGGGKSVRFPGPVTVTCEFASKFAVWLSADVATAATTHFGSELTRIVTGPGYQCRRRNNKPDGKLSEHALGNAIDISAFEIGPDIRIRIGENWSDDTRKGRFLKDIHTAACKRFTTVLGPDADPDHKSHFHLDIGCHGKNCTYLICQ